MGWLNRVKELGNDSDNKWEEPLIGCIAACSIHRAPPCSYAIVSATWIRFTLVLNEGVEEEDTLSVPPKVAVGFLSLRKKGGI